MKIVMPRICHVLSRALCSNVALQPRGFSSLRIHSVSSKVLCSNVAFQPRVLRQKIPLKALSLAVLPAIMASPASVAQSISTQILFKDELLDTLEGANQAARSCVEKNCLVIIRFGREKSLWGVFVPTDYEKVNLPKGIFVRSDDNEDVTLNSFNAVLNYERDEIVINQARFVSILCLKEEDLKQIRDLPGYKKVIRQAKSSFGARLLDHWIFVNRYGGFSLD